MKSHLLFFTSIAIAASTMLACSSSSSSGGTTGGDTGPGGGAPTIKITSPADKSTANVTTTSADVDIAYTVTGFTLMEPNKCAGAANCGHVHALVDGTDCNDTGLPANAETSKNPVAIGLDYCKKGIAGTHVVVLELHNDDHSPVKNAAGTTVSDTITITAKLTADADAGTDAKTD